MPDEPQSPEGYDPTLRLNGKQTPAVRTAKPELKPAETGEPAKTQAQIRTITDEVQHLKGSLASITARLPSPFAKIFKSAFLAKITGVNAGGDSYTWQEQTNVGGTVGDFTGGRLCDDDTHASAATEINGWLFVPTDTLVLMLEIQDTTDFRYQFVVPVPPPALQDGTTDYVLGYTGANQFMAWEEVEECTEEEAALEDWE
jgi:hypothetical protein